MYSNDSEVLYVMAEECHVSIEMVNYQMRVIHCSNSGGGLYVRAMIGVKYIILSKNHATDKQDVTILLNAVTLRFDP
jgi:hypothetical protein